MSTMPYARSREEIPLLRFEKTAMEDKIASEQTGRVEYMDVVKVYIRAPGDMRTEVPDIAMRTEYDVIEQDVDVEQPVTHHILGEDGETREETTKMMVKQKRKLYTKRIAYPWLERLQEQLKAGTMAKPQYDKLKAAFDSFMANSEAPIDGTPLAAWTGVGPAIKAKLISMGINTIERLAELTEEGLSHVGMGSRDAKNSAISYLQKVGNIDKGATDSVRLESELAARDEQMREMQEQIKQLTALQQKQQDITEQAKRGRPKKEAKATA